MLRWEQETTTRSRNSKARGWHWLLAVSSQQAMWWGGHSQVESACFHSPALPYDQPLGLCASFILTGTWPDYPSEAAPRAKQV